MAVNDTKMLNRLEGIATMPETARDQVLHEIDALIFKAMFDGHRQELSIIFDTNNVNY